MVFIQKEIYIHGGKKYYLLTPNFKTEATGLAVLGKWYTCLISDSNEYSLLTDIFAIAGTLKENELIFLPLNFKRKEKFEDYFGKSVDYFDSIVIFNYCTTQIDTKEINLLLKNKNIKQNVIEKNATFPKSYPDYWKINRRLTVKRKGKLLTISGNRDIFNMLAYTCFKNTEVYDYDYNNYGYGHIHHDWYENTSKSAGITFYTW